MRAFGASLSDYVAPRPCGPGIWQLTLPVGAYVKSVNAYLIEDEDGVTLVDSGVGNDATWEVVNRGLDELHVPLQHINRILLTHAHPSRRGRPARGTTRRAAAADAGAGAERAALRSRGPHPDRSLRLPGRLDA